jgi:sporulation protein YlmC with PRC-barrel domain
MFEGFIMETIVDFVSKVSEMVKNSMDQTQSCIGKEFIDSTAGKKGICVDRITDFFGTKISFLGVKYGKDEQETIDKIKSDILVCQTEKGRVFVPMDGINAVGESLILLKTELKVPEINATIAKKSDVFKRYHLTTEAIKDALPTAVPKEREKDNKGWLKKIVGE